MLPELAMTGVPDPLDEAERRLRLADVRGVEGLIATVQDDPTLAPRTAARCATAAMHMEFLRANPDAALRHSRIAIKLWEAVDEPGEAAVARAIVGRILINAGAGEDALQEVLAAHEAAERSGDATAVMRADATVGHVFYGIQHYDQALEYFTRALAGARRAGDRIMEGSMIDNCACAHGSKAMTPPVAGTDEMRRLLELAAGMSGEAIGIARAVGHRHNESAAVANRAEALLLLERPAEALALMQSWVIDPEHDPDRIVWHLRDTEGTVCMALGRNDEAIDHLTEALEHAETSTHRMTSCQHLAEVYERTGDLARALHFHRRFHDHFKQVASESAQRSASVAAVRMETLQALAKADEQRDLAQRLEISNAVLRSQANSLKQLSYEDALTGLGNRRMLDKLLELEAGDYAIAMIDVDHFKRINDGWSHVVGDAVLRQLASLIKRCCRATDTPIRCGGEEFAVVFEQLDDRSTRLAATRIRQVVESFDWGSIGSNLHVTVSIGIASGAEASAGLAVLGIADQRLYEAKHAGRNRVAGLEG